MPLLWKATFDDSGHTSIILLPSESLQRQLRHRLSHHSMSRSQILGSSIYRLAGSDSQLEILKEDYGYGVGVLLALSVFLFYSFSRPSCITDSRLMDNWLIR